MRTLTLQDAAALLQLHPTILAARAKAGLIPGAKLGRRWVFLDVDLIEYLRGRYAPRALQELGGWECAEMVRRYAHLSSEHLAVYAERMSGTTTAATTAANVLGFDLATLNIRNGESTLASC